MVWRENYGGVVDTDIPCFRVEVRNNTAVGVCQAQNFPGRAHGLSRIGSKGNRFEPAASLSTGKETAREYGTTCTDEIGGTEIQGASTKTR